MKYAVIFLALCSMAACVTLDESGSVHGQGLHDFDISMDGLPLIDPGLNLSISENGIVVLGNGTQIQFTENGWVVLA